MKRLIPVSIALLLAACGEGYKDLQTFVKDSEKNVPRTIEPLPQVKPFAPFAYEGFDLPDPFRPRKLAIKQDAGSGGGAGPDLNRRKEPLEAYPLEQLKMVGTIDQAGAKYALVRADRTLYRIKKGNYLGQNFGLITDITDTEIKLKEIVQDTAGDWTERESSLPLLEGTGGK
ncbi:MAG: pilus assembly protein PilP [Betaproteobacteria bacterium]|nr:pilus assembly protein PilP [Betaproteobacteria bacterium]